MEIKSALVTKSMNSLLVTQSIYMHCILIIFFLSECILCLKVALQMPVVGLILLLGIHVLQLRMNYPYESHYLLCASLYSFSYTQNTKM